MSMCINGIGCLHLQHKLFSFDTACIDIVPDYLSKLGKRSHAQVHLVQADRIFEYF